MSPIDPDFEYLHEHGFADVWWFVTLIMGTLSASLPILVAHYSLGILWLSIITGLVSYYWFLDHLIRLGRKERVTVSLKAQNLDLRIWAVSKKQQLDAGFEEVGTYYGFQMLSRPIGEDTEIFEGHEFIVRDSRDTIAVANVIRVHDQAHWPLAIYETLELDGEAISLASLFEKPEVRARMRLAQSAISDFICVGLVSNQIETVGTEGAKKLSELRANSLGVALISHAGLDYRRSQFYGIGLGQALTFAAEPESLISRNQRSAVVLAITRRQDVPELLSLEKISEALVQNYQSDRLDLSRYEYSGDIARQLVDSEIDFAGFV